MGKEGQGEWKGGKGDREGRKVRVKREREKKK